MADRRMLWRSVSQSRKVNSLSLKATLLWTWSIPWLDRDGRIEVEGDFLKTNVLPRRKDIQEEEIPELVTEIVNAGLWITFNDENGYLIAQEKQFKEHQGIEYKREIKSKWEGKILTPVNISRKSAVSQSDISPEGKVVEGKVRKGKAGENENDLPVDNFEKSALEEPEKSLITQEQKESLNRLALLTINAFKAFNPYAFIQNNLKAHPEALIKTLSRMLEDKDQIISPWSWAEYVLNVESQNYNETDFQKKSEKKKNIYSELLEGIKTLNKERDTKGDPDK